MDNLCINGLEFPDCCCKVYSMYLQSILFWKDCLQLVSSYAARSKRRNDTCVLLSPSKLELVWSCWTFQWTEPGMHFVLYICHLQSISTWYHRRPNCSAQLLLMHPKAWRTALLLLARLVGRYGQSTCSVLAPDTLWFSSRLLIQQRRNWFRHFSIYPVGAPEGGHLTISNSHHCWCIEEFTIYSITRYFQLVPSPLLLLPFEP